MFNTAVLFGGNGFIGSYLAAHLLTQKLVTNIVIADSDPIRPDLWPRDLQHAFAAGQIEYVQLDVRQPITDERLPKSADLIVNLAAVHREPGHEPEEYFATNIPGAKNVCAWAETVGCNYIIFTSTIATYGGRQESKDENSTPEPVSPYGISKLQAEEIHRQWQAASSGRKLMIVRPGVIFGAGERGNVTRMVKALLGHYFFYTGNQAVRKAGGYIKELCNSIIFMMRRQIEQNHSVTLFNFTMDPAPSVKDYTDAITKVAGITRKVWNVPFRVLLLGSYVIAAYDKLTGRKANINPARVRKLRRYNNIVPKVLREAGYEYQYTLEEGLKDWQHERPEDW
jgi:GlcNAc-P-P-Und epimerase